MQNLKRAFWGTLAVLVLPSAPRKNGATKRCPGNRLHEHSDDPRTAAALAGGLVGRPRQNVPLAHLARHRRPCDVRYPLALGEWPDMDGRLGVTGATGAWGEAHD